MAVQSQVQYQETAKSIQVAGTLGRCILIMAPLYEFLLQLNEIIQILVLLPLDLLT